MKSSKFIVEVHIGKDVLSYDKHIERETAQRQADRLLAAGHKVRIWHDGRMVFEKEPI